MKNCEGIIVKLLETQCFSYIYFIYTTDIYIKKERKKRMALKMHYFLLCSKDFIFCF